MSQGKEHASFLSMALVYAALGMAVLPLQPRGKKPLSAHGLNDATTDVALITEWWSKWPEANIGIATGAMSSLWVLDIDPEHGGEISLFALEGTHGKLPSTMEVITGGGGRHLYFSWPQDGNISSTAGRIAPGLDVRATGGYIVACGSVHPSGKRYEWSVDSADSARADAPPWLLGLVQAPPQRKTISDWRELVKGAQEGERNSAIARLAGKLLGHKIDPYIALELCLAWNDSRCRPPLEHIEVVTTVDSIAGRELAKQGDKNGKH